MRILPLLLALLVAAPASAADLTDSLPDIRKGFTDWMADNRVPGLVWGIVKDGQLVHVEAAGVQDLDTKAPVTADTAFRIASMSKAFTAYAVLSLEQQGRLRRTDEAAAHVPELEGWAKGITVAHLMHHNAGFVTDDPWGDRQQVLTPYQFSALLKAGVPFSAAPGSRFEYSNLGYATLGRIVTNLTGQSFQSHITDTVFRPLGMASTTYDVSAVPQARLAVGYRWENNRWSPEPTLADGEFGAMGGIVTTADDYAKWVAHLLSGWPADASAVAENALLRSMRNGGGTLHNRPRSGADEPGCRTLSLIYAAGLLVGQDCVLGAVMFHGGGYPGYGSHMLLLPEAGVGLFAFANRTYAGPIAPVWDAATKMARAGLASPRPVAGSPALDQGYAQARRIWAEGRIDADPDALAVNMLLDRPADLWAADIAGLKAELGDCDMSTPVQPAGALSGRFQWPCTTGRLNGQLLLAPTPDTRIQALRLSRP